MALLLGLLLLLNLLVWALTWGASHTYALLLSTGLLAYSFGLRHAVDADHISAIDNATRKLMQQGQRPLGVGFFFSLGHSTVVTALCAGMAVSTAYVQKHLGQWHSIGGVVGVFVSGAFLYIIGFVNLVVLVDLFRAWRAAAAGKAGGGPRLDALPAPGGLMGRFTRPLFRLVQSSRQMYWIGLLFGLGFDTATEVGVLAVSARSGQAGMPFWTIMLLPALFTAGMCLVDTLDGALMLGAYGWAFVTPARKMAYNLCITLLSVVVAFVVGTYELLQIMGAQFRPRGGFWEGIERVRFDNLGFAIVGLFLAGWALSALIAKWKRSKPA